MIFNSCLPLKVILHFYTIIPSDRHTYSLPLSIGVKNNVELPKCRAKEPHTDLMIATFIMLSTFFWLVNVVLEYLCHN